MLRSRQCPRNDIHRRNRIFTRLLLWGGGDHYIIPDYRGAEFVGGIYGYEENGIYLEIKTCYEVQIGSSLMIDTPFTFLKFDLTSGSPFNLDSIDLIAAMILPTWASGWDDEEYNPEYDIYLDRYRDVEYLLTGSNGASYVFPTSDTYQYRNINFGNLFQEIEYFTITVSGTKLEDQHLIIDNVSITPVPEPATMLLFGAGIAGLAAVRRRKRN